MNTTESERAIKALLELSGFPDGNDVQRMEKLIAKAPDPETACQVITDEFQATGALERQWRKIISQTWHSTHARSSHGFDLPLTSQDVLEVPALIDARRFLEELQETPASLAKEGKETLIAPQELPRLVKAMPSLNGARLPDTFEHEWAVVRLHRLRMLLQTLKLVRVYQGKLQVVRSRYEKFVDLPLPQQFYVLWHADVYHIPWATYSAAWSSYVDVVQEYLPLLWDISRGTIHGQTQTSVELTFSLLDVYNALWDQEGLMREEEEPRTLFSLYQETALPGVIDQLVVRDIFARYGLLEAHEGLHALIRSDNSWWVEPQRMVVRWTPVGEQMLKLERSGDLPCALEMLK